MNQDLLIGSHIFIIEDDLLMQFLYKRIFSRSCVLTVFDNGADALSAMQNGVIPDIVITDLNVPKLNGMELLSKIKDNEEWSHIPMMIISGDHSETTQAKSLEAGASDYVTKPFDVVQITERVGKNISAASLKLKLMHA